VVICLERGADLHMAQLMPLPLTVSCFSKIQTGFTFLVPAHPGSPGKWPLNGCVCYYPGAMQSSERGRAWRDCRVFYLTPQVVCNDLSRNICPADAIKCLIIDEAHKALGNHSYCQVVRELTKVGCHRDMRACVCVCV